MEESDKTQIDKTQIEEERTQVERRDQPEEETTALKTFKGWKIAKELPAIGGEADAFVIEKAGITHFLKLYRKGVNPKIEVLQKVKELSENIPEHVVRVYSVGFDDKTGRYYEVMEYARYGNLREAYEKYNLKIEDIVKELGEAIHYLHQHNIIHRDIKPTNILVREIEPLDLLLTDFGISSAVMEDVSKVLTTVKGTFQYSAPETFSGYFGKEIDWWSLGMIVYELLTGSNPFRGLSQQVIMNKLITENVPIPKNIDERYQLLLKGLLTRDPKKRWKWEEIERWLKGERDIKVYYGEPVERKEYSEDEWQRQGFTPQGAQRWKETGFSPVEARAFRDGGFTPAEAKEWAQVGIRDAITAKGWRDIGVKPQEALKFDELGIGHVKVSELINAGLSTKDIVDLIENEGASLRDIEEFLADINAALTILRTAYDSVNSSIPEVQTGIDAIAKSIVSRMDIKDPDEYFIYYIQTYMKDVPKKTVSSGDIYKAGEIYAFAEATYQLIKLSKEVLPLPGDFRIKFFMGEQVQPYVALAFKLWKKGLKPLNIISITLWKSEGFEPEEAVAWKLKGFLCKDAKKLRDAGLSPDDALRWINIFPKDADWEKVIENTIALKKAGFTPEEVKEWLEAIKSKKWWWNVAEEAVKWKKVGFTPKEAKEWIKYFDHVSEAKEWRDAGFTIEEVKELKEYFKDASEARAWLDAGFSPEQAVKLKKQGFKPLEAKKLVSEGWEEYDFSEEEINEWKSRGFIPNDAYMWKLYGVTPEQADKLRDLGVKYTELPKWFKKGIMDVEEIIKIKEQKTGKNLIKIMQNNYSHSGSDQPKAGCSVILAIIASGLLSILFVAINLLK